MMTQEEKAKRYDEAFEKAQQWYNAPNADKMPTFANKVIKEIFPELAESEDESNLQGIIDEIEANKHSAPDYDLATYDRFLSWLKSLKDRVQPQTKKEWSEEDERIGKELTDFCIKCSQGDTVVNSQNDFTRWSTWLKSIKPQNNWKPSEEQIEALEHFVRSIGESGYASPYENNTKLLYSLLEQIKKLREE